MILRGLMLPSVLYLMSEGNIFRFITVQFVVIQHTTQYSPARFVLLEQHLIIMSTTFKNHICNLT